MNRLMTLSIIVTLLPAVAVAHWIEEIVIVPPVPTTVAPGETIDVVFNYTTRDAKVPRDHSADCPWRVRLDSVNPSDGELLDSGLNTHYLLDPEYMTFNEVASVTIPSDTTIGSHSIVVWAGTDPLWSWPASDLIIKSYVIPIQVVSPVLTVDIDIKPGSTPNTINLGSNGVVPVAILSSADFDATTVDPDTVALAGSGVAVRGKGNKYLAHEEDVNDDGLLDLVCQVETENLDPGIEQDGYAELTGNLLEEFGGTPIKGSDEITIVPPE
ncbi:MAG: hypothetical protein AMJ75_11340 [Phycisphaerae bacterium SM1_79]|nr:MAG: hypothetical protein AMJ75_11340 [Phycisphaerae bacterium SM1_79]